MQKAKKRPSGSWTIQVYDHTTPDGKRKYKTFTHKNKEIVEDQARAFERAKKKARKLKRQNPEAFERKTVGKVLDEYIAAFQSETDIISQTTLDGYCSIRNNSFPHLMDVYVDELDNLFIREAIKTECERPNRWGRLYAPKTIRNRWAFIAEALNNVCHLKFDVSLPALDEDEDNLPDLQDVLEAIRDSGEIQLACMLALHSLRMSEVRGLKCDAVDLKNQIISVKMKTVDTTVGTITSSRNKTKFSKRIVHINEETAELILQSEAYQNYLKTGKNGFLVPLNHNQIYGRFKSVIRRHGIKHMTFHNLRTMYASVMLNVLQVPVRAVEREGGWKPGSTVLRRYYSKSFDSVDAEAHRMRDELYKLNDKNAKKNQNAIRNDNPDNENS